jgi:hypothetical protein
MPFLTPDMREFLMVLAELLEADDDRRRRILATIWRTLAEQPAGQ